MGNFDTEGEDSLFQTSAADHTGRAVDADARRTYALDFSALIEGGRISVTVSRGGTDYSGADIDELISAFQNYLTDIIAYCEQVESPELSVSGLRFDDMSLDELEGVFD
jgi:non-ribosomal peptide synthase protein (TIGR01720 family)